MVRVGLVGVGRMGSAMARALLRSNVVEQVILADKNREKLDVFSGEAHVVVAESSEALAAQADIIMVCVKPDQLPEVFAALKGKVAGKIVLSIAAGVRLQTLQEGFGTDRVVRVMPNVACLVGEMAAGYAVAGGITAGEAAQVAGLLDAAGAAVLVEERAMDAITGLAGSGPAFFAHIVGACIDAGMENGLDREAATELAVQTALGTAAMLRSGVSVEEIEAMVTSPGGTTEAGRRVLERSDVRDVIKRTIKAATERSRELGER